MSNPIMRVKREEDAGRRTTLFRMKNESTGREHVVACSEVFATTTSILIDEIARAFGFDVSYRDGQSEEKK